MKNKGLRQYRFSNNPLEKLFAEEWEKENNKPLGGNGHLDYMLAKDCNFPRGEVAERDREVAATVIQWIGTPVGQFFVQRVMERYKDANNKKRITNEKCQSQLNMMFSSVRYIFPLKGLICLVFTGNSENAQYVIMKMLKLNTGILVDIYTDIILTVRQGCLIGTV
jgi:hypothetical protein